MSQSNEDAAVVPDTIRTAVASIMPPDRQWEAHAADRQALLTMPPGSLGRLLELGRQLAGLQQTDRPEGHPALIAVFAADHGVAGEGVSAYPSEVTGQMVANYLRGGAAVNVLARRAGATVRVADLGVTHWPAEVESHEALVRCPIAPGTANLLHGAAMSRADAFRAFDTGLNLADRWIGEDGPRVVALGEMGIGNSTTAAALIAALTGTSATDVVGRGTGVDDRGLVRKRDVVAQAVRRHTSNLRDDWDCFARLGGFEILGLAGLAIGAAKRRALVVLDGLISTCAGLVAVRICPPVRDYLVAAHRGTEPGHRVALAALGLMPLLNLDLRLGEGTGAALALPLIASAGDILRDMATFDSAGVSGPSSSSGHA
ncbi:MAG: nicotinate-nucleotide--dimethylbenzimidazole phosphoribosyltransferase [Isosphaeraceae bacterium]|nr:nicotinate-nucleotide--dimethylbenzimidazole phosphoribosyltransferase [Isosphaeraceae bacterium]